MIHFILEKAKPDRILYYYIDFDRTLAHHETSWGSEKIGKPIPKMLARIKKLLQNGKKIKIFTARAGEKGQKEKIQNWLEDNGLPRLPITNVKGIDVLEIWDDKARQVEPNKGELK